jgi:SsrA-binding protein
MAGDHHKTIARNRRARFEYELLEEYEAGLALLGTEVKSLRAGKASIAEAYVRIRDGEAWLLGANIPLYPQAHQTNHEPARPRKLLLGRQELRKIERSTRDRGLTVVPLELYFKGSWVKLAIAVGRGRKSHDKREYLKKKEDRREMRQRG